MFLLCSRDLPDLMENARVDNRPVLKKDNLGDVETNTTQSINTR